MHFVVKAKTTKKEKNKGEKKKKEIKRKIRLKLSKLIKSEHNLCAKRRQRG